MAKYARIENSTVMEIIDFNPVGKFHPDIQWVKCTTDTKILDTYDGSTFIAYVEPVVPSPEEVRAQTLAAMSEAQRAEVLAAEAEILALGK